MPTFNTYQPPIGETPIARKWFVRALIASILLHAGIYVTFRFTKLEHFTPYTERLVPRAFTSLGRVDIDPKLLADEPTPKPADSKADHPIPIEVPKEQPSVETNPQDVVFKPTAPESVKPIATENPNVTDTDIKTMTKLQQSATKDMDSELNSVSEQLLKEKPDSAKPLIKITDSKSGGSAKALSGGESAIPGTKSLDDALSGTGGSLQNGDKIGIKGGALFEYNKAELRPEALSGSLKQLALLVKRYPNATLIIAGYADSIGDPNYNIELSQKRAEAVKAWLVQSLGIEGSKVQAVGKGSTKFIDPPTYDSTKQDQESNNRRVEIQFQFPT